MSLSAPKGVAKTLMFPLFKSDGTIITGAAGTDSEVSKDHAAFADCTSEVAEVGSSGWYWITLTSTEMNADQVAYQLKSSSTGAVLVALVIDTYTIPEPAAVPTWPMSLETVLGWLGALARNKRYVTDTTQTLRNDADSATIATSSVSDDATTGTRQEWA